MPEQIPSAQQSANAIVDTMHGIAASHEWLGALVGKVIAPPPDIKIAVNNIVLDKNDVYIDEFLLAGYKRFARGRIESATQEAGHHTHKHDIHNAYRETWITVDTLQVGDLVSVMPLKGGQQFIVLGKLIYLGDGYKGAEK